MKLQQSYRLSSPSPEMNGRPCWVQKVKNSDNLYVFSQAKMPNEQGFPYVQSLLMELSPEGNLTEYGSDVVLGKITTVSKDEKAYPAIEWIDGTNVTWICYEA